MRKGFRLHNINEQEVIDSYNTGKTVRDVAKDFGVGYWIIFSILKKNGAVGRKRGPSSVWSDKKIERALLREYPLIGAKAFIEKHHLKTTLHDVRCKAHNSGIKVTKKTYRSIYKEMCKTRPKPEGKKRTIFLDDAAIVERYKSGESAAEIARTIGLKGEYAVILALKRNNIKVKNTGDDYTQEEDDYIRRNYWETDAEHMKKIMKRSWRSIKKRAMFLEVKRNKFKFISKGLNKCEMTSIEKVMKRILEKNGIQYEYNKYVKTRSGYYFPDFLVKNVVFECDGEPWHRDTQKETKRDGELSSSGYTVYHFTDQQLLKQEAEVERCVLSALRQ